MKERLYQFAEKRKYELLLGALIIHLYIGILLKVTLFYSNVIWPINMIFIILASSGIFLGKGRQKNRLRNVLSIIVIFTPLAISTWGMSDGMSDSNLRMISIIYFIYFLFIFSEVLSFLLRPNYINADIILASVCGYFLLVEVGLFLLQFIYYLNPESLTNIDSSNPASTYMDLVYFSSITITTIGYGDIIPASHATKLVVALFGVISHLYSVLLIGILISKFSAQKPSS